MTRRHFLTAAALTCGGALLPRRALEAVEPFTRGNGPAFRLSLAAYSFRDHFKDPSKMDMKKFIDYCASLGLSGAELTSYYFPSGAGTDLMAEVRRHAFLRGITVSGTAVGNNFALPDGDERNKEIASVKEWIDRAAVLSAPHIRVFAGSAKGVDEATGRKQVIAALEECGEYAGKQGIFLGVENHGGVVAKPEGLLEIIRTVKSPWVGVNLDTGNFHGADPYADLEQCAPWAVNVQVKCEIRPAGAKENQPSDYAKIAKILSTSGYRGWVVLEYESKPDPFTAVPEHLKQLRAALSL